MEHQHDSMCVNVLETHALLTDLVERACKHTTSWTGERAVSVGRGADAVRETPRSAIYLSEAVQEPPRLSKGIHLLTLSPQRYPLYSRHRRHTLVFYSPAVVDTVEEAA